MTVTPRGRRVLPADLFRRCRTWLHCTERDRLRYEVGSPASRWIRPHRRAPAHQRPRRIRRLATNRPLACSWLHRGFQQGIFVAEEVAGLARAPSTRRASRGHLLRARSPLGRSHRGAGQGEVRRQRSRPTSTTSAATARVRFADRRLRQTGPPKDGPAVGVHMVGSRVGELIGEGLVNWNRGHPEDVASLIHAHPTQNGRSGEAFSPRRRRHAACTARLTRALARAAPERNDHPARTDRRTRFMPSPVTMPQLGESVTEGNGHAGWTRSATSVGRRFAAARGLDRQGRHRDPRPASACCSPSPPRRTTSSRSAASSWIGDAEAEAGSRGAGSGRAARSLPRPCLPRCGPGS